jgi:hypothetical protein
MAMSSQLHAPAAFLPEKEHPPLVPVRRLVEPQSGSGCCGGEKYPFPRRESNPSHSVPMHLF